MQNIEFGAVSSDRYPDPAENACIEAIPILNIGSAHPYFNLTRTSDPFVSKKKKNSVKTNYKIESPSLDSHIFFYVSKYFAITF